MGLLKKLLPFSVKNTAPDRGVPQPTSYSMLYRGLGETTYVLSTLPLSVIIANYKKIAPLYSAVSRLSDAVASLPYILIETETGVPDLKHPAYKLLQNPNPERQKIRQEFIRDYITWYILHGNAFMHLITSNQRRNAKPLELSILNPQEITVENQGDTLIVQTTSDRFTYTKDIRTGEFTQQNQVIYHVPNFNADSSENEHLGQSELASLYYELNHYIHASQHNLGLIANGARPCGAFYVETQDGSPAFLSDKQFNSLKQQINLSYSGSQNSGKPLLLEGGLKWQEMAMSPKDMDFTKMKEQAEEQIYRNLGIPTQLMTSEKTTSNNMENIRLEFYENRVLPLADAFCAHMNRFLLPKYENAQETHEFKVDRDDIDVLLKNRINRDKALEGSMIRTLNEKRKLKKLPPIKGGNKIIDPNGRGVAGEDVDLAIGGVPPMSQENQEQEASN